MRLQEKKAFPNTDLNDLKESRETLQSKHNTQCTQSKHSIQKNKKFRISLPLTFCRISVMFLLSSCGIYNGGFQRGGEATSSFLERIEENPKDEEDTLLPPQKETETCSKLSQKSARR